MQLVSVCGSVEATAMISPGLSPGEEAFHSLATRRYLLDGF